MTTEFMNLFIIIVSFNSGEDVRSLVESLGKEKISGWEMKMVVIDNNSSDSNLRSLQPLDPSTSEDTGRYPSSLGMTMMIINNKTNLGFAKGANIGIKYALDNGADRILLLNPDTKIETGFIQPLVENSADIISPVIKFKRDGNWIYDFGGRVNWNIGRTKHLEYIKRAPLAELQGVPLIIDYVSGCCMLIKRQVFEKIGFFDERFFLYFEDADFCTRARMAGLKVAVEQKSVIIHNLIEGVKKPLSSQVELIKSNFKFINKYLGGKRILGYLYLSVLTTKIFMDRFSFTRLISNKIPLQR